MSEITQVSINDSVIIKDGQTLTSSLSVAYAFNKPHRSVLRVADQVQKRAAQNCATPLYKKIVFIDSSYVHPQNHQAYRKILMNKRAFMNVVMSFTGDMAFIFKNMFFDAFDNMEKQLRNTKPPMNKLVQRDKKLLQNKVDTLGPALHQEKHLNWYEEQTVKAMKPKADAYDREMVSPNVFPLSDLAERYGTDAMTLNLVLNKIGIVRKLGGKWYLTKNFLDRKYACHNLDGLNEGRNTSSLKWTHRGFNFIRQMLKLHFGVTELHQLGDEFNNTFLLVQKDHKYEVKELTTKQLGLVQNWEEK